MYITMRYIHISALIVHNYLVLLSIKADPFVFMQLLSEGNWTNKILVIVAW